MNKRKNTFQRRIPLLVLGSFGFQVLNALTTMGNFGLPRAAAFTTSVENQIVDNEEIGLRNEQHINEGGIARNTKIGDLQNVYSGGISYDTQIEGGQQNVYDGGIANDTTISDSGIQFLYAFGSANNTTANGGTIYILENNTSLTGTTILNNGSLRISEGSDFIIANIENLAGNGSIFLNTNLEDLAGDRIQISGTTIGTHQVFVNNQGGAAVDPDKSLTIIETSDGSGNFLLEHQLEVGGYLYDLRPTNGILDRELYRTNKGTSSASASIDAFAGGYLLNYAETQTLLQRMGDLRQTDSQYGAWARIHGGKFDANGSSFLSGFDMTYSGVQVGYDQKISLKNGKGDFYIGGMFGYGKGNLDYMTGNGSGDSKSFGVYGTYLGPTGLYADLVLKYGWMKHDFKVLDTAGDRVTGSDIDTNGVSASLEVGKRIHLNKEQKQGWYVEPQAQLSMGPQSGARFTASNGLRVDVDSYTSTLGRVGMNIGCEIKKGGESGQCLWKSLLSA